MIICKILGGLGNQMFQYAAGRALSIYSGNPLLLDLRSFQHYKLHNGFEIGQIFCAPVQVATNDDISQVLGWRGHDLIAKVLKRAQSSLLNGPRLAIEPHSHYWPKLKEFTAPFYFQGYWQSDKYFMEYEQVIRSDFCFKEPLSGVNLDSSVRIQGCNSVSLHVRRGDYVTHAPTTKILNPCPVEYYETAIACIAARINSPCFFVFSDDPQWVRRNLSIPFPVEYVDGNRGPQSYIDMQLMSLCKHHIIANSSFSWWGAWLNRNPDKLVFAPRRWFCNGMNDSDLTPQDWIKL